MTLMDKVKHAMGSDKEASGTHDSHDSRGTHDNTGNTSERIQEGSGDGFKNSSLGSMDGKAARNGQ